MRAENSIIKGVRADMCAVCDDFDTTTYLQQVSDEDVAIETTCEYEILCTAMMMQEVREHPATLKGAWHAITDRGSLREAQAPCKGKKHAHGTA